MINFDSQDDSRKNKETEKETEKQETNTLLDETVSK
jgi:hypothetical protein